MKKITFLIFLLFSFQLLSEAQNFTLTDSTHFSLLTCSPGPAAYEKFGHTAIRIYDNTQSIDFIANWGLFDFDKPGFYYKFVKGETYYMLGLSETFYFLESYRKRNSQVTEQLLNLNQSEKQKLLDIILTNYQPENREYLYNFVFDNCATRPRDKIVELFIGNKVNYGYVSESRTYREWIANYAGSQSWLMFGIDLLFGRDADKTAGQWETMFLPEVLANEFQETSISKNDSTHIPLVLEKRIIVDNVEVEEKPNWFLTPFAIALLIFLIGALLTYYGIKKHKKLKTLDFLLLLISGLAGFIIFYLMFFSIHPLVKSNINVLWCMPLNLFAAILIWFKSAKRILTVYSIFYSVIILFAFILSVTNFQVINFAFLPLMGLLFLRSVNWVFVNYNIEKSNRLKR